MPTPNFHNAPDAGQAFLQAKEPPKPPEKAPATPDHPGPAEPDIDHLDLATLDYTPGGALEYEVHRELSGDARRQYLEQTRQEAPSEEKFYADQIDRQFERAAKPAVKDRQPSAEDDRDRPPTSLERANQERTLREQEQKAKQPEGHCNGVNPTRSSDPPAPEKQAPLTRDESPAPDRASRFGRDRSSGGREH
jgi:hypothetical protein